MGQPWSRWIIGQRLGLHRELSTRAFRPRPHLEAVRPWRTWVTPNLAKPAAAWIHRQHSRSLDHLFCGNGVELLIQARSSLLDPVSGVNLAPDLGCRRGTFLPGPGRNSHCSEPSEVLSLRHRSPIAFCCFHGLLPIYLCIPCFKWDSATGAGQSRPVSERHA